jgi:uncharacterized protein
LRSVIEKVRAALGHRAAQLSLAQGHFMGVGGDKSDRALYWAQRAGKNGEPLGYLLAANILLTRTLSDDVKAQIFQAYRNAARLDSPAGQRALAWCYDQGIGVPKDPALAFSWLTSAADNGDKESQLELARKFAEGDGAQVDEIKARKYFSMATRQP